MQVFVTGLRGIPDVMGGVETHCEALLPRLSRLRPQYRIVVLGRQGYVPPGSREYRGVGVRALPAPPKQSIEAIGSTLIGTLYARWKGARLLHIHAIGPALLTPLARLLGLRVVVTHHGADYARAKWGRVARTMLRLGEAMSLRFADRVICVAPSLRHELAARRPERADRFVYIPNGTPADSDAGAPAPLGALGVEARRFLLAVGRLVPEKGFDYLIDAVEALDPPQKLVIVGGGDHATPYIEKLRARAGDRVIFAGMQPREVVMALYRQARLFVLPSFHEGLPIVALEAGCVGTPMLLSDIPAHRDLGLSEPHYFPVGDRDALAGRLAEPADACAVDAAALRRAFDWDAIARETAAVYDSVLIGG